MNLHSANNYIKNSIPTKYTIKQCKHKVYTKRTKTLSTHTQRKMKKGLLTTSRLKNYQNFHRFLGKNTSLLFFSMFNVHSYGNDIFFTIRNFAISQRIKYFIASVSAAMAVGWTAPLYFIVQVIMMNNKSRLASQTTTKGTERQVNAA